MSALVSREGNVEGRSRGLSVTARGLGRTFGAAPVLRNLALHVPAGQFLAVVGRSGSGKSTLLRLLGGLDRPDAGHVTISRVASALPSNSAYPSCRYEQDGVGEPTPSCLGGRDNRAEARIMFQEPRLLPWASVLDNVAVGLGPAPGPDGPERASAALARVGLDSRARDWPAGLSGGQKSRVALARALVSRPRMLLLDEPLGALDALTRIEMQDLLHDTWIEGGFTAVLVTHDVSEAVSLADRVVVIEDGTVAMDVAVNLPPRARRGSAEAAALERSILDRLLGRPGA